MDALEDVLRKTDYAPQTSARSILFWRYATSMTDLIHNALPDRAGTRWQTGPAGDNQV
jgi:hypothetical protein